MYQKLYRQIRMTGFGDFIGTDLSAFYLECEQRGISDYYEKDELWAKISILDEVRAKFIERDRKLEEQKNSNHSSGGSTYRGR